MGFWHTDLPSLERSVQRLVYSVIDGEGMRGLVPKNAECYRDANLVLCDEERWGGGGWGWCLYSVLICAFCIIVPIGNCAIGKVGSFSPLRGKPAATESRYQA